jgi:hypothetical protein
LTLVADDSRRKSKSWKSGSKEEIVKTKLVIAVGAAVMAVAVPVSAWAEAQSAPSTDPPCREAGWMQEHSAGMGDHWAEMDAFMDEHADEMRSWMCSEALGGGGGMMGGYGMGHTGPGMSHGAFGMGHAGSGMGHAARGSMWQSPGS